MNKLAMETRKNTHSRLHLRENQEKIPTAKKLLGKWETLATEINVIVDRNAVRMPNKLFARLERFARCKWGA